MSSPVRAREWEQKLTIKCRFCGGPQCKRCSEHAALAKIDSPISGLHADWVTDRILGMMRPSSRLIKQYHIIDQFHRHRITAVFNLTIPGEHPFCGDGLGSSGFPYDPEIDFMAQKIQFYNFGWEDMTVPTLSLMMDIVKVMTSMLQDGMQKVGAVFIPSKVLNFCQVAVHCHAGYGRTGLAIACALIFMHGISPERAIHIVRRDRPGSIQTPSQAIFVREFCEYMSCARLTFALPFIHEPFTLSQAIEQQNRLIHGTHTGRRSFQISRILDFLCYQVERLAEESSIEVIEAFLHHPSQTHIQLRHGGSEDLRFVEGIDRREKDLKENLMGSELQSTFVSDELYAIKVGFNEGQHCWGSLHESWSSEKAIRVLPALLLDWLEHLSEPLLSVSMISPQVLIQMSGLPMSIALAIDRILKLLRILLRGRIHSSCFEDIYCRIGMAVFHLRQSESNVGYCTVVREASKLLQALSREWKLREPLPLNLDLIQRLNAEDPQRLSSLPSPRKPSESRNLYPLSTRTNLEDLPRRLSAVLSDGTSVSPVTVKSNSPCPPGCHLEPLPGLLPNKSNRSQQAVDP
uniref:Uncharacterized protein AlNc14C5G789 n=1 Tax=Albugo laibachii Nc14 TaxID=890382 RepID=F0W109_9STRA|nr:conserved hypothetical protein [Albugo laibachii Nc14]|eukprot:CCA14733.1 conserved hypothetical protein [Albugo laibachii Nc14]